MSILMVGIGFVMLLIGRPAYASFVGGIGFLLGFSLIDRLPVVSSSWNIILLPLLFAAFGALAAFAFRRWAVRVAGYFAGSFLLTNMPLVLGSGRSWDSLFVLLVVGGACFLLLLLWFEVSLVILSCLTGAIIILQSMRFGGLNVTSMFIVLMLFGLITQFLLLQYASPSPD